jgi:hypothetical protein
MAGFIPWDGLPSSINCLGDSSIHTTGKSALYGLLYTSNTRSMFATNSLLCAGGMTQPFTFQGLSSFFLEHF